MQLEETVAEKVGALLGAEVERTAEKFIVKKNRKLQICNEDVCFVCNLDLDISFKRFGQSGMALNKAEILLLPEESEPFTFALMNHEISFPTSFRQWQVDNPHIISINIESVEPPEHFAERLSSALNFIEQKENRGHQKTSS